MNYLAHAFLAGNDESLILGNFIADHLRGSSLAEFPEGVQNGILLHRRIDTFTDQHELFRRAKRFFYQGFERHSGILTDIYFDHLLASDFESFANESLKNFSQRIYGIYKANRENLPVGSRRFLDYLLTNDLYVRYSEMDGIETVLSHLSHRLQHGVLLHESVGLFEKNRDSLKELFEPFMQELIGEFRQ